MENLEVFTARDLRQRSGELFSDAERGQLSLITKNGRPAMIAVPFDQRLLESGVHRALALNLFEAGQLSLAQAAKVAGLSQESFMEVLVEVGTPAVDYPPQELEGELDAARCTGAVTPELERLAQSGYRLAPALVEEIRRLAGE